jgi:hypothetical protein
MLRNGRAATTMDTSAMFCWLTLLMVTPSYAPPAEIREGKQALRQSIEIDIRSAEGTNDIPSLAKRGRVREGANLTRHLRHDN